MKTLPPAALLALALAGCAPSLLDDYPFDGQAGGSDGPKLTVVVDASGVRSALVDATSQGSQVFVDLDNDVELKADEAFATNAWDLAFQRYKISANGGPSSPQGVVKVAVLKGVAFEALTTAPETGWQQDGADPVINTAEGGWYTYDLGVHRLVTRPDLLYVIETSERHFLKLAMGSYYDPAGTPARLSFRYAQVAAPAVLP